MDGDEADNQLIFFGNLVIVNYRAETNTYNCDYSIVLVVFVKKIW